MKFIYLRNGKYFYVSEEKVYKDIKYKSGNKWHSIKDGDFCGDIWKVLEELGDIAGRLSWDLYKDERIATKAKFKIFDKAFDKLCNLRSA